MNVSDFDFDLPPSLIASHPPKYREDARLLQVNGLKNLSIRDLAQLAQQGDVWVINNTCVIPARLFGKRATGGKVELLLLQADSHNQWQAWLKSNNKLKEGEVIQIADDFSIELQHRKGKTWIIQLNTDDVDAALSQHGHMPLPPYINRADILEDKERYQTVFAKQKGAVAAPTAGLHLTHELMQHIKTQGASFHEVTLHVGAGTFQPVQAETLAEHQMHSEYYDIPQSTADAVNLARKENRRVIAVGTTSLRSLEAAFKDGDVQAGSDYTDIFIYPSCQLNVVNTLLTNFHLPRSTLLMLVSAMAGTDTIMHAYEHAKAEQYRFFSYGDAMWVEGKS
ncbi:MAG: tRNA preQ1(34) S-adenosylmethionine ribosyltransferase-isomerase QueA [Mariprofundaceae bacterium]|nr:tRNA preQ1(34) S-adenosylmethionine ribosyltransferase-isomerase QueA [Mariprofundaceae bacterium]